MSTTLLPTLSFCLIASLISMSQTSAPLGPGSSPQKTKGVKAAARSSANASTHVTVSIDQPFTQGMADRAGLDPDLPQLSSDGVQSGKIGSGGTEQKLASSECLLAETLILRGNGFLNDDEVDDFCTKAKDAKTSKKIDDVKSSLEEHAGTRIDDAVIHIVSWHKGEADGNWYHYDRHSNGWSGKLVPLGKGDAVTSLDHLLGHGNVAFLAIHLGVDDTCNISYDIKAEHTRPLNQQDLADLIKLAKDYLTKGTSSGGTTAENASKTKGSEFAFFLKQSDVKIGVWGGETILKLPSLPASITLTPKTGKSVVSEASIEESWQVSTSCSAPDHTSSSPTEDKNSQANARYPSEVLPVVWTHTDQTAKRTFLNRFPFAHRRLINLTAPADSNGKDSAAKDPLSSMGMTVPNEGIYWWDVSVAMPVTSYKNLKFDSQNNLVVLKKTNDIKPYALFDFYPGGADLRAKNGISMVGLSAGIPMGNKPLQRSFVGGGFVLAIKSFRFQPLVGVRIQKDVLPSTLTPGTAANAAQLTNDLRSEWHAKLQVMIGFSIADARKVLGLK